MTLNPQIASLHAATAGSPSFEELGVEGARALSKAGNRPSEISVKHVEDIFIDAGTHTIPCRMYSNTDEARASIINVHGGGWALGDLDTSDDVCRAFAHGGNVRVINVDYRLAPEHPFPAGLEDVCAVIRWVADQFPDTPLGLAGDSAGANLVAVAARLLSDRVHGLSLIHPALDMSFSYPSYHDTETSRPVSLADMQWFRAQYAPDTPPTDVRLSPDLHPIRDAHHPRTYLLTVQYCPLRDEGKHYAQMLEHAQVPLVYEHAMDMCHAFLRLADRVDAAAKWRNRVVEQTLATVGVGTSQ